MSKGKTTTTQEAVVPEYAENLYRELSRKAMEAADLPYQAYTGQPVAPLTAQELQAGGAIEGLFSSALGYDPAKALQDIVSQPVPTLEAAPSFLDVDIGAYQSPYQQQVIDLALQDIGKAEDVARQQAEDVALRAGAFGGSRGTIYEQEALRPFAEEKLRTVAGLRQAGYEDAAARAARDLENQLRVSLARPSVELAATQQRADIIEGLLGGQQQAIGSMLGFGGLQRSLEQAQRDFAIQEFMREQGYPAYQVGLLGQASAGLPQSIIGRTITDETTAGPMGILGGAAGLASSLALGGINPFSFLGGKTATPSASQIYEQINMPSTLLGSGTGFKLSGT